MELRRVHYRYKAMRSANEMDPKESGYHYLLGMMLAAAGDFDAARQAQRRALVIDPQNVQAYIALSNLALLQNGDVDAATRVLDQMAPGTPVNAAVAITRIDLLLYQRRFAAARAMAERYAGTFTAGPAALDMVFARANVEWMAGKTGA